MVLEILPKWYAETEKEIRHNIMKVAMKNNINYKFIGDSKTIDDSINAIMNVFVRTSQEGKQVTFNTPDSEKPKPKVASAKKVVKKPIKKTSTPIPPSTISDLYTPDDKKDEKPINNPVS